MKATQQYFPDVGAVYFFNGVTVKTENLPNFNY